MDTAHAVFYQAETLLNLLCDHYRCKQPAQLVSAIVDDKMGNTMGGSFLNMYGGREVKMTHSGIRKKIKDFGPAADRYMIPDVEQKDGSKRTMSIKDYMQQRYNIKLRVSILF